MKKLFCIILFIITIVSCNTDIEQLRDQNAFYKNELFRSLKFEVTCLEEDLFEINKDLRRVSPTLSDEAIDPYEETDLYFEIKKIKLKFRQIEKKLEDENYSLLAIKEELDDSLFQKHFKSNFSKNYIEFDKSFDSDSLDRLYLKTVFYKIEKEVLLNLMYQELGCATLSNPMITLNNINNTVFLSFGIIDTNSQKQILIDSIYINGVKKETSYTVEHSSTFSKIKFEDYGEIEYYGRYFLWSPVLNDQTFVNFSGKIKK